MSQSQRVQFLQVRESRRDLPAVASEFQVGQIHQSRQDLRQRLHALGPAPVPAQVEMDEQGQGRQRLRDSPEAIAAQTHGTMQIEQIEVFQMGAATEGDRAQRKYRQIS
jgi:hypothetical protein